jgi:hypothetical protein
MSGVAPRAVPSAAVARSIFPRCRFQSADVITDPEGIMGRLIIAVALLTALTPIATSNNQSKPASGGVPDRNGGAAMGHVKPLPPFVVKREKDRLTAADLVARGLAVPDAEGIVTLRNGRFVDYESCEGGKIICPRAQRATHTALYRSTRSHKPYPR